MADDLRQMPDEHRLALLAYLRLPSHDEEGRENQLPETLVKTYWQAARFFRSDTWPLEQQMLGVICFTHSLMFPDAPQSLPREAVDLIPLDLPTDTDIEVQQPRGWEPAKLLGYNDSGEVDYELVGDPSVRRQAKREHVRLPAEEPVAAGA